MHTLSSDSITPPPKSPRSALAAVLQLAKQLHRAAKAESPATALPVLRRLLASGAWHGSTLPSLYAARATVQRKHLLRMLAIEAGASSWEAYRAALDHTSSAQLTHFDLLRSQAGYPNCWFSTFDEAEQHAKQHGGRVLRVGQQAVVLAEPTH